MRFFERRRGFVRPVLTILCHTTIVSGVLCACGPDFSSKSNQPTPVSTPTVNKDLRNKNEEPVTSSIIGLEPYRYQVTLRWAPELTNVSVYIDKQFAFKAESSSVTSYSVGLDHNRDYLVTVYSQKDKEAKPTVVSEFQLQTPLDVVLSTEFFNSAPVVENKISVQAHRIFVLSKVITGGKNILLNTDEFIVDQALISTFDENQKAPLDNLGRSGGGIFIKAQKAKGQIEFVFRGESGGDGMDGAPFTERAAAGANGADGLSDYWDSEKRGGWVCDRQPEDGRPGVPGSNGRSGTNGKAGGNTGSLHLEIADASPEFHYKIEKVLGIAGQFGKGGPGQLGGVGGQPGKPSNKCKSASTGPEGKPGDKGADGIREKDGIIEQDCVSIGEGFGRCS